jgi:hypothetical protein
MRRFWRGSAEQGATAIIVAIVIVVLFGMTALSIDVFRMYEERRQLQTTADASAISGAQELRTSAAAAESTAKEYIKQNPTTHHLAGWYTGDASGAPSPCDPTSPTTTYDCVQVLQNSTACDPNGVVSYDCVISQVVAPPKSQNAAGFNFLFARILGFTERAIRARAKAVLGAGAPGGDKLVPWLVRDCPRYDLATNLQYPQYVGEDNPTVRAFAETDPNTSYGCPYRFSADYANGPFVSLFLGTGTQGNYQGGDLATYSANNCPPVNGYFAPNNDSSGANDYRGFLGRNRTPCAIFAGARIHAKTGQMSGPTQQGLDDRNVDSCINNPSEYQAAVTPINTATGEVRINHWNPCMVAVAVVVHTKEECPGEHPQLRIKEAPGDTAAMQREIYANVRQGGACQISTDLEDGRFGPFANGTSKVMIVRRIALFYIVNRIGNNQEDYRGLFLRAIDSEDAELGPGRCDSESSICVVKLVG